MISLFEDLRYGLRLMVKSPAFTAVAVLTLALGIGANTVIFSGVYAILFRSLPYENADRLTLLSNIDKRSGTASSVSYPDFADWREQSVVFERMAAFTNWNVRLTAGGAPEHLEGRAVSDDFFPLFGVAPLLGRDFLPGEYDFDSNVVIISQRLWQRRFAEDSELIGKTLTLNGQDFTVVAVMPASFDYPPSTEIWVPLAAITQPSTLRDREARFLQVAAALKPDVTIERAGVEMNSLSRGLELRYPDTNESLEVSITFLQEARAGKYRRLLLVLQWAVGFVLLIACANLANMLLARAASRQKEFSIRLALGCSRARLIRQLLTESMLLAFLGGGLGLLLAAWGIDYLSVVVSERIPRLKSFGPVGIDGRVLAFTLIASLFTGLIFGLFPALLASKPDLNESLKEGGKGFISGLRHRRMGKWLVVSEVALSLVLLIGAGLMIRTFDNLQKVDPGFDPANVLTVRVTLPESEYESNEQTAAFFQSVRNRIESLPGVKAAGAVTYLPLIGWNPGTSFLIEGQPPPVTGQLPRSDIQPVTPGYFNAMGMRLLRGRQFTEDDLKESPEVAIINETMARKFLPDRNPFSQFIQLGERDSTSPRLTIVGIVKDVRQFGLHAEPRPEIYIPAYRRTMTLIVRTSVDPSSLAGPVREQVLAVDSSQPVYSVRTMREVLAGSIESRRLNAILLGVLGVIALALAAMGIYSLMSYRVAQRRQEIGIRMALGANRIDLLRMVLIEGVATTLMGIGIGMAGGFFITRVLAGQLYGVSATSPATFTLASLMLVAVALAASFLPAWRATKVDPMEALRYE